ncbi:MAG: hypothetical protein HYT87_08365 [Nitrospirae bacterium]|nr:hypothetical protein [Nitrospirota bacterium]
MEGILSAQQLSFSYQRLSYGYIQNGQIDEQQVLEGRNLRELADKLFELPGETVETDGAADPLESLRQEVGQGTAFYVTYEEIHLEFSQVQLQTGDALGDPNGADTVDGLLGKINKAFEQIRNATLKPSDDLRSQIQQLIESAFSRSADKLDKLGEVRDPTRQKLDKLLEDIRKLIDQTFGAPAA